MRVEIIPCLQDNYSYIIIDEKNNTACVVDPSEAAPIINFLRKDNIKLKYILNTHHHFDHIGGNEDLKKEFKSIVVGFKGDSKRIPGIEVLLEDGDIFVVISASGNSENLITAVEYAKQRGNFTVGLLGFDGGKLMKIVDLDLLVGSAPGDYGPVEDAHLIINHLLMNYFLRLAKDQDEA